MRKISLLVFILLFTFCTSEDSNTVNEDGMINEWEMVTCDEDQKDSEGRCYEPDDPLSGPGNDSFIIFPGTEDEANKIIECVRKYDASLQDFPDAVVNSSEVAFKVTNYIDGTDGLIDAAFADCGF